MAHAPDPGTEVALKALTRHLVLSFPDAAILSREVGDRYHVFIIIPYVGGPERTLQVERAWLGESAGSIKACEQVLEALDLPRLFQTRERYELRYVGFPQCERAARNPANEGWSAEPSAVRCAMAQSRFQVRPHHRIPVQCPVHIQSEDAIGTGSLWNVS